MATKISEWYLLEFLKAKMVPLFVSVTTDCINKMMSNEISFEVKLCGCSPRLVEHSYSIMNAYFNVMNNSKKQKKISL